MPGFYLKIESRGRSQQRQPIPEDLYRIGSGAACQIRIACRSDHALTLLRRQGRYAVVNRTQQPVRIGGRAVRPEAMVAWPAGKRLTVEGVTLTLVADQATPASSDSARRVPAGQTREASSSGPVERTDSATATDNDNSKRRSQYAVIVSCVTLILAMQWVGAGDIGQHRDTEVRSQQIAESLRSMAAQSESAPDRARRATALLDLLAQYRLACILDEPDNKQRARSEVINFCHSLNCSTRTTPDEHAIARDMLLLVN